MVDGEAEAVRDVLGADRPDEVDRDDAAMHAAVFVDDLKDRETHPAAEYTWLRVAAIAHAAQSRYHPARRREAWICRHRYTTPSRSKMTPRIALEAVWKVPALRARGR